MQRVKLYLRCGHVVEFECDHFEITYNGFYKITKLTWVSGSSKEILRHVDVDEIVAITYQDIEEQR